MEPGRELGLGQVRELVLVLGRVRVVLAPEPGLELERAVELVPERAEVLVLAQVGVREPGLGLVLAQAEQEVEQIQGPALVQGRVVQGLVLDLEREREQEVGPIQVLAPVLELVLAPAREVTVQEAQATQWTAELEQGPPARLEVPTVPPRPAL